MTNSIPVNWISEFITIFLDISSLLPRLLVFECARIKWREGDPCLWNCSSPVSFKWLLKETSRFQSQNHLYQDISVSALEECGLRWKVSGPGHNPLGRVLHLSELWRIWAHDDFIFTLQLSGFGGNSRLSPRVQTPKTTEEGNQVVICFIF